MYAQMNFQMIDLSHIMPRHLGLSLLLTLCSIYAVGLSNRSEINFRVSGKEDLEFDRLFFDDQDDLYFVEGIVKDPFGYIWVGTKEGLYRYDGRSRKQAGVPSGELKQLYNGAVLGMSLRDNTLWFSSQQMICAMDISSYTIECFSTPLMDEPQIGSSYRGVIYACDQGIIYAGYWNGGLVILNTQSGKTTHIYGKEHQDAVDFTGNPVTDIQPLDHQHLLIATHNGLFSLDKETHNIEAWGNLSFNQGMESGQFNCIHQSVNGTIWLGSNNGMLRLDRVSGTRKNYHFDQAPITDFERNIVESITETSDGTLWIGTRYGLYKFDPYTEVVQAFYHNQYNPNSIHRNYIRTVFADDNDIVWIGHHSGAISLLTRRKKSFTSYQILSDHIAEQRVHSIYAEDNLIWFGTETGLFCYDRKAKKIKHYHHDPDDPSSISHNFVSGIIEDPQGYFWISTDKGGVNTFDPATGQFRNIIKGSQSLATFSQSDVWSIHLDKTGTLWSGTGGDGLLGYHTRSGHIERYTHNPESSASLSGNFIGPVIRGHDGMMWVGTWGDGLNWFVPGQDTVYMANTSSISGQRLSGDFVTSLSMGNDNLYIATNAGIDILNLNTNTIRPFHHNEALPSKAVQSLLLDKTGNLWIATRRGMMKYEPSPDLYQLFYKSDGLCSNAFISGSCYQSASGELFFGTQNGFVSFFPWDIEKNIQPPPVVITDISIFDQSLLFDQTTFTLNRQNQLTLPYNKNNLGFQFASLDFHDPAKNRIKYMLEGLDSDWIEDQFHGMARYNNIPPGQYVFRVIGSNNDNIWNTEGAAIHVIIKPPFWDTIWFKIAVFVGLLAAIFLFIYKQVSKVSKQKSELERLVAIRTSEIEEQKNQIQRKNHFLQEQKNAIEHQALMLSSINKKLEEQKLAMQKQAEQLQEMDRIKSRFFAGISHEFRTPLTLILNAHSMLQKELSNLDDEYARDLKMSVIGKNAARLQRLIDQLLDLIKIESGFMNLSVTKGNVKNFVESITRLFEPMAEAEKISFHIHYELSSEEAWIDWDKLDKILYNLLSNAIKFTRHDGRIQVRVTDQVYDENRYLQIEVIDTGCGIPPDQQNKVFTMFYQGDKENTGEHGTGIGLALTKQLVQIHRGDINLDSIPGKGCRFAISLPVYKSAFTADEIQEQNKVTLTDLHQAAQDVRHVTLDELTEPDSGVRPKILFVDDNKDLCMLIKLHLKEYFEVEVAHDGIKGLEKALNQYPDVIVSDLMMPGISGIEFCRRVKEDMRTEHLPFILLTARTEEHAVLEAYASKADDYITKPFSTDILLLKLKNQLSFRKKLEDKLRKELREPSTVSSGNYSSRFLAAATSIILENIEEPGFSVDDLAGALHMSRTQLYRKSESLLGMSVNNYIKQVKLNKAHELLKDGEFNISEVAYKTGFKTPGYFSKCFEARFGKLPSLFLAETHNQI